MTTIFSFPECRAAAARLAEALGLPCAEIEVHRFPDGESLVRVPDAPGQAIIYRSLDRPNAKLVELMLAATELRSRGASRLTLVAPYLAYMRQDIAFHPGEVVSQRVVTGFLARLFDATITVDPHLHRVASLDGLFGAGHAAAVSAAPALVELLQRDGFDPETLLIAPDSEARPWVERVATPLGLDMLVAEKERDGDRQVRISIPGVERVAGRPVVLVDDMVSTGVTLGRCASLLRDAGASAVEALTVHCLASDADLAALKAAGVARLRSVDTVEHSTNAMVIAPLIADALKKRAGESSSG